MLFGIEIFDLSSKWSVYTFILKILINITLGQDPWFIAIPVVNNPERVKISSNSLCCGKGEQDSKLSTPILESDFYP